MMADTTRNSQITARYASLLGRTVVVTGGASGIGAEIVKAFAKQGCRVAFLDIQLDQGNSLTRSLTPDVEHPPLFHCCDLQDIAALRFEIARIHAILGPAAVLVNNAAVDQRHDFDALEPDDFDRMMRLNLRHVVFASQAVLPQMRRLGFGSIINMTSGAWMRGTAAMESYSAAKAGIVGFTNSLAREVGSDRIRVNAIAPGLVMTERQRSLWYRDETAVTAAMTRQSLPDPVEPGDIAAAALFLASDDSRAITRQCLLVNGGSM
jgi:NAD(P)-dependent dehydrogenase (short-subunit alcohol dehydrogenase family)